jgi:hypothetical protein
MELMGELQAEGAMTDEMSKRDLHHCFYGRSAGNAAVVPCCPCMHVDSPACPCMPAASSAIARYFSKLLVLAVLCPGSISQAPDLPILLLLPCRLSPHLYPDPRPEISIMLQYFNRPWQVPKVLEPLLKCR